MLRLCMILLGPSCSLLCAQDRILLMSGHEIMGKVLGQSTLEIRYEAFRRDGTLTLRDEPTENVFSVTDSTGKERIWYFHDPAFGNDYTVEQMRWYISGERDARAGYMPKGPALGGFLLGAGLTLALDLEVASALIAPIYGATMALPRVHVTAGSVTDPLMEGDPYYATGYATVGRGKRVIWSLIGSFAGAALGYSINRLVIVPE
jgi:hypothetical protein